MDDFSLDDLMAELDAVQAEETKHKLSERNCVEILQTLIKSGLLRGLMYTLDGKEYLTPEQLKREVRYELQVAGGRVSLGAWTLERRLRGASRGDFAASHAHWRPCCKK